MRALLTLTAGIAIGIAVERYRRDWQASAWAYELRQDRLYSERS